MKRTLASAFLPSALAFAAAAGLCVLLLLEASSFEDSFLKMARMDIRSETEHVTEDLSKLLKAGDFESVRAYADDIRHAGTRITVLDLKGNVIADVGKHVRSERTRHKEFVETLANGELVTVRPTYALGEYRLYSSRKIGNYVVVLAIPYRQAREPILLAGVSMVVSILVGIFMAVAVYLMTRQLHRRIAALDEEKREQVRRLAEAERLERFRREFIENVSHEVKTPLAAVEGAVEALRAGGLSEPERAPLLDVVFSETKRMESLVRDILCLARLEAVEDAASGFVSCDFGLLVLNAAERFRREARDAGVTIRTDGVTTGVRIPGDERMVEMAVGNLLSNAIKYGGGVDVAVSLVREGGRAVLRVADGGPGIAPEHLPRIFERFYRVDKARSRESGGTGLGLAIVKHVAKLHGGVARCESVVGRGSTFILEVPCELS